MPDAASSRTTPRPGEQGRRVRLAVKALVVRDGLLLVTANRDDRPGRGGTFYLCPGGGQEHGEDARTALVRECREELGCEVEVGDLAFVRDYVGARHEFAETDAHAHQVEAYFWCSLPPDAEPDLATRHDRWQSGASWLPLDALGDEPVYPRALAGWLASAEGERPRYLGDVN